MKEHEHPFWQYKRNLLRQEAAAPKPVPVPNKKKPEKPKDDTE